MRKLENREFSIARSCLSTRKPDSFTFANQRKSNELVCCTIPALLVVSRFYSATGEKKNSSIVSLCIRFLCSRQNPCCYSASPPTRESENRILFSRCISTRHNRENLENTCFLVVNAQNQKSVCALHARQKSAVVCLAIGVVNKYITRIWTRASPITVWARPMRMLNVYSSSKKRVIYIGTALVLIPLLLFRLTSYLARAPACSRRHEKLVRIRRTRADETRVGQILLAILEYLRIISPSFPDFSLSNTILNYLCTSLQIGISLAYYMSIISGDTLTQFSIRLCTRCSCDDCTVVFLC